MNETYEYADIAKMIDHSLLNPSLTVAELEDGCLLARTYDVASVCVLPYYVSRSAELLAGTSVRCSTTIGFPHGGHVTSIKLAEARQALADGATELDMVINISQARSGEWNYVEQEIRALCETAHVAGARLKVIFENAYHDTAAKIRLCEICGAVGVDWVKTSTGYAPGGATMDDLRLMRKHSPPAVQVKAAGGIRDLDSLLAVRELGVTRVGATRTASMLDAGRQRLGLPPISYHSTVPVGG
jgi:deoxyribose-phosphate aldolase